MTLAGACNSPTGRKASPWETSRVKPIRLCRNVTCREGVGTRHGINKNLARTRRAAHASFMLALGDHVAFGAPSKHKPHGPPSFSDRDERVLTKVHLGEKWSTSCGQGMARQKLGIAAMRYPGFLLANCVHQSQVPGTRQTQKPKTTRREQWRKPTSIPGTW